MKNAQQQKAQNMIVIANITLQATINFRSGGVIIWWKNNKKQILTAKIHVQVKMPMEICIRWNIEIRR